MICRQGLVTLYNQLFHDSQIFLAQHFGETVTLQHIKPIQCKSKEAWLLITP